MLKIFDGLSFSFECAKNTMKNTEHFGQRLKQAMLEKGYKSMPGTETGVELRPFARAANIHPYLLKRYILGQSIPKPNVFEKLSEYLDVSISYLREGIEPSMLMQVPLLNWEEAVNWKPGKASTHKINISLSIKFSPSLFALKITDDKYRPGFPPGTVIFIDAEKKPTSRAFVIVAEKDSKKADFRQLLIEEGEYYLRPLNFEFPPNLMSKTNKVKGVLIGADYAKTKF